MPADVLNGNEAQLFHGCSDDAVGSIVSSPCDLRLLVTYGLCLREYL